MSETQMLTKYVSLTDSFEVLTKFNLDFPQRSACKVIYYSPNSYESRSMI